MEGDFSMEFFDENPSLVSLLEQALDGSPEEVEGCKEVNVEPPCGKEIVEEHINGQSDSELPNSLPDQADSLQQNECPKGKKIKRKYVKSTEKDRKRKNELEDSSKPIIEKAKKQKPQNNPQESITVTEKEKKSKNMSPKEDIDQSGIVLEYMKQQNRPYSLQNIFDNLHGSVGKTLLQKILDTLSHENRIICKEYGKFKVYLYEQSQLGEAMNEQQILSLETEISDLRESIQEAEEKTKLLKSQILQFESNKVNRQNAGAQKLELEAREMIDKLSKVKVESTQWPSVDFEELDKLKRALKDKQELWSKRKKLCNSLLHNIAQMADLKAGDLIDELGIEMDP